MHKPQESSILYILNIQVEPLEVFHAHDECSSQALYVRDIYLHFALNVAIFDLGFW